MESDGAKLYSFPPPSLQQMTTRNRKPAPSPAPSPDDREILSPEELAAAMANASADADANANADADDDAQTDADADADADDSPLLLNPADLIAALKAARESERSSGRSSTSSSGERIATRCHWKTADIMGAKSLPVPIDLPERFPSKAPSGASLKSPAFIGAPKDLDALDLPPCQPIRNDVLRSAVRAALLNDYLGIQLYKGRSAADGGVMPLAALWLVLSTEPERQKVRKWSQRLWVSSGQGSITSQLADIAGRYAIVRPEGVRLVRDFYGEEMI